MQSHDNGPKGEELIVHTEEEESIRSIMEQLSFSRQEAAAWRQNFVRKYFADREVIYAFLKEHNPRVRQMETDEGYQRRFASVAERMRISLATAKAHVIVGDIGAEGGMKILRKKKHRSQMADFQKMLGVSVRIPTKVLNALGIENL